MSPYHDHFENYISIAPKLITAADKCYFQAIGKEDLHIKIPNRSNQTTILLKNVLHCLDMGLMLVFIGKITGAGYKVMFKGSICSIYNTKDKVIGQILARNRFYQVDCEILSITTMAGDTWEVLIIKELHCHLGHIAPEAAKKMVSSGTIEGIEVDLTSTLQTCNSCEYAKATQKPIKKFHETPRASKFGDEIHSDVWGPSPIQTPGHKEYYVSLTNDHTHWTHLQLLATKDGIFEAYKDFKAWAKLQFSIPAIKTLHSDRWAKYLGKAFSQHLQSQRTERKLTIHDTPEYNGVSEHLNWTLLEQTHTLLHSSKLPKNLWGEVINHAVWLKNRMVTWGLPDEKTPFEMLYGKKPNLRKLYEWGNQVWVHTLGGSKLDGWSKMGKWIRYNEISNGHRIYWPNKCSVTVEHSIKFSNDKLILPSISVTQPIQGELAVGKTTKN